MVLTLGQCPYSSTDWLELLYPQHCATPEIPPRRQPHGGHCLLGLMVSCLHMLSQVLSLGNPNVDFLACLSPLQLPHLCYLALKSLANFAPLDFCLFGSGRMLCCVSMLSACTLAPESVPRKKGGSNVVFTSHVSFLSSTTSGTAYCPLPDESCLISFV